MIFLLLMSLNAQMPPEMGSDPSQTLMNEAMLSGPIWQEILTKGVSADLLVNQGDEFAKISKPAQAIKFYEEALKLDKDHAGAADGYKKSADRVKHLAQRVETLTKRAKEKDDYQSMLGVASIYFHLGKPERAFEIMNEAAKTFGLNSEMIQLKTVFADGEKIRGDLMNSQYQEFLRLVGDKKKEESLQAFGRLMLLSYTDMDTPQLVESLTGAFSDLDKKKILASVKFLDP